MAPRLVREPFHRAGWVYEEKVDGWRMLAYKDGAHVCLVSRNGVDHTQRFRDLATAVGKLSARTLVLDGEVAIFPPARSRTTDRTAVAQNVARQGRRLDHPGVWFTTVQGAIFVMCVLIFRRGVVGDLGRLLGKPL